MIEGVRFDLDDLPALRDVRPLLLFPGRAAQPLHSVQQSQVSGVAGSGTPSAQMIVLIDGTWRQARNILRHSPQLLSHAIQVSLTTPTTSLIEPLRREPAEHCISTAEACAAALRHVEGGGMGERAAHHLEEALRRMVAQELRHKPPAPPRTPTRKLRSLSSQLTAMLTA